MAGNPPKPPVLTFYRQEGKPDNKIEFAPQDLNKHVLFPAMVEKNRNLYQIQTGNGLLIARKIKNDGNLDDGYIIYRFNTENNQWMPAEEKTTENDLKQFLKAAYQRNRQSFDDAVFKRDWQDHWITPKDITSKGYELAGIDSHLIVNGLFFISDPHGIRLPLKSPIDVADALDKQTISFLKQMRQRNSASEKGAQLLANEHLVTAPTNIDNFVNPIIDAGVKKNKLIFTELFQDLGFPRLVNGFSGIIDNHHDFVLVLDEKGQIPRPARFAAAEMTRNPTEANIKAFLQFTTSKDIKLPDDIITQIQQAIEQDIKTLKQTVLGNFATIPPTNLSDSQIQQEIKKAEIFFKKPTQQVDEFAQTYCKKDWVTHNELLNLQRKRIILSQTQTDIDTVIQQLAAIRRKKSEIDDENNDLDKLDTQIFGLDTLKQKIGETLELSRNIKSDQTRFTIFTQDNNTKKYQTSQASDIKSLLEHSNVKLDPETTAETTINYRKIPKKDEVNGELMIDNTNPEKMRESMRQTIKHFVGNVGAYKDFHLRHDDPQLIAYAFGELISAGVETRNIHLPPDIVKNFLTEIISSLPKKNILKFTPNEIKEWPSELRHIIETQSGCFNDFTPEQQAAIQGKSFSQSHFLTLRSR